MKKIIKWTLSFISVVLLTLGLSNVLNPSMERIEQCYEGFAISSDTLQSLARRGELFANHFEPESDSTDASLLSDNGLDGFVSPGKLNSYDKRLSNEVEIIFSGDAYFRHSSFLERSIGGGSDKLFYEVNIGGLRYLIYQKFVDLPHIENCGGKL
ncbi:hypothetical protein [Parendozoicomonas haliclonae]|uniref:Uncharacterized protein n=1 Tax=Parendozoicomonas haliclonae TaxID=1960125 RepID=A0A1X7AS31_9GAMM|nr:hypothetical protein [Parendozoicomonas haliclonae]SMA50952.1 hypothetical protein EHSB41UT_04770 [Parendozoicomonas haliclonae]